MNTGLDYGALLKTEEVLSGRLLGCLGSARLMQYNAKCMRYIKIVFA